jgi:hypothetical protein
MHSAQSKTIAGPLISANSFLKNFTVGTENVAEPRTAASLPANSGDIDNDNHVDLVDFSIMAYWYGRSGFPAAYDLNGDGKIDLADFSIMAYYWTG